jgi:hypothetical protein
MARVQVMEAPLVERELDLPFGPVFVATGEERRSRLLAGAGGLAERVLSGSGVPAR